MLYRASAKDLKSGAISRRYSYTVVVMRFYPRYLAKSLVDEYIAELAPEKALFQEFKRLDREFKDHARAFEQVEYERRFAITAQGKIHLERLSELARSRDVFLICQCQSLEKCHADLLLMAAKKWFGVPTRAPRVEYPIFSERLERDEL